MGRRAPRENEATGTPTGSRTAADVEKCLKDLNLSTQEVDKFDKAFKDPKFKQLFEEYVSEISTPEARAEQEEYLRQIERNGEAESIYGKGTQLVVPECGCVVKTRIKATNTKVFINVCTSEKVEKAESKRATDANGVIGWQWDIPISMGAPKTGLDKKESECKVVDFVVHPCTLAVASTNRKVRDMLAETAIEKIEAHHGWKLCRKYRIPKMKYKRANGSDRPSVMAIRKGQGEKVGDAFVEAREGHTGFPKEHQKRENKNGSKSERRSTFSFFRQQGQTAHNSTSNSRDTTIIESPKPVGDDSTDEEIPKYEIIFSGRADLSRAWGDAGRTIAMPSTIPEKIVVRIWVPKMASMQAAQLDVTPASLKFLAPGIYKLDAKIPHIADASKGRAKFDKNKRLLTVTLPTNVEECARQSQCHNELHNGPSASHIPAVCIEEASRAGFPVGNDNDDGQRMPCHAVSSVVKGMNGPHLASPQLSCVERVTSGADAVQHDGGSAAEKVPGSTGAESISKQAPPVCQAAREIIPTRLDSGLGNGDEEAVSTCLEHVPPSGVHSKAGSSAATGAYNGVSSMTTSTSKICIQPTANEKRWKDIHVERDRIDWKHRPDTALIEEDVLRQNAIEHAGGSDKSMSEECQERLPSEDFPNGEGKSEKSESRLGMIFSREQPEASRQLCGAEEKECSGRHEISRGTSSAFQGSTGIKGQDVAADIAQNGDTSDWKLESPSINTQMAEEID